MVSTNSLKQYVHADRSLMPLDNKIPREGWRERIYEESELTKHKGNIGMALMSDDLVIDVDPRNGGTESFEKLKQTLGLDFTPTVLTPRGGFHIYLSIPEKFRDFSFKKNLKEFAGIDFLTEGSYCLIEGCKTKNGVYTWFDELVEFERSPAPEKLLNFIGHKKEKSEHGDFEGIVGGSSSNWPEEKILKMLAKLDPSMPNSEWVKVGMALHDWCPISGIDLWENWSKAGDNYIEGETEKRWRSFDITPSGVTLGTISYMVKEVNYDENADKVNGLLERIKAADEKTLEFEIFPKLRKSNFSKINIEKLAKAIQDRFKEVTSVKIPIGNVRQLIMAPELVSGQFIDDSEVPEWCKSWVYVNSHAAFVNIEHLKLFKTEAFNIVNGKYVPESQSGTKQSAAKYIADKGFVQPVDVMSYLPSVKDQICTIDEHKVLNSFNPKSVPIEADHYSDNGLEAIELVKKHIKFICTTEENTKIFTQWLAHNVQFPGKQILWSPVIQSIQGVGKSFFGELLRMCLGDRNVGTVAPTQVISDFNGWATGVMVNVLEELRVKGHNRYDAVNSLKPLVTDRMIQINDKGVKQFMTYNTTNYICFTNYKDAIPLDQDDRRWWVVFVPIENLAQMRDVVGEEVSTYFPKLFDAVRTHGPEIRKWLLEFEISAEFLAIKQAPMTDCKRSMIDTEEASFDGYVEIRDLIKEGGKYFNEEVICCNDLFEAVMFSNPEVEIQGSQRNRILKKLGYSAVGKLIKIDGKPRRVWSKKRLSNDEIRFALKKSEIENDDDL